jgi:predicted metal-dependent peptidase
MMERSHQRIDDEISRAAFDLLLKEPFYAHVLAGMPRVLTGEVRSMGLRWNGQQILLQVNPDWFAKSLSAAQRQVALKHEVLHIVFRHLFRPRDRDRALYSVAADLVVNQLLSPLKPLPDWPVLKTFPELQLKPDRTLDEYYGALAALLRQMQQAGFDAGTSDADEGGGGAEGSGKQQAGFDAGTSDAGKGAGGAKGSGKPKSAEALAKLLAQRGKVADDSGWHDGQDGLAASAGRYAVGSLLIRARDRMPPSQWGSLPAMLLSELELILAERQPKLDWKRVVRIFCASSGRSRIRHTMKRTSKRYGTRPGIKVQRLQRLLVAVDTSGSIDQEMLEAFFAEIHGAWKAGATVHVVECDAEIQRDYPYAGKPPRDISGGGGTEFEPVFRWMQDKAQFDGCLYLTDGYGPAPTTRPRCKLLWVITGGEEDAGDPMPFGPSVYLKLDYEH